MATYSFTKMLRTFISCSFFLLLSHFGLAQEKKTIRTNEIKNALPGFLNQKYEIGAVYFKDGSVVNALLNFNRLSNQVFFISQNNDTLVLANPEKIFMVSIAKDTLFIDGKTVLRKLTSFGQAPNLFVRQEIKFVGKENKGAYGSYSEISSVNSASTYSNDDQITRYINIDENVLYKVTNYYYLNNEENRFYPVTKKYIKKVFKNHVDAVNNYISSERINLDKEADIVKLLKYERGLN